MSVEDPPLGCLAIQLACCLPVVTQGSSSPLPPSQGALSVYLFIHAPRRAKERPSFAQTPARTSRADDKERRAHRRDAVLATTTARTIARWAGKLG